MPHDIEVMLVCPKCRTAVQPAPDAYVCTSETCRLSYPVIDTIPKFLIDDARPLDPLEWASIMNSGAVPVSPLS